MTIPNIISLVRLILVPVVIVMLTQHLWLAAFLVFVVAGVSDAVDGFIARRFGMHSELGAYLDPLADKALLVSIYVTLSVIGILPVWLAIVVVSRDMMIVAAILLSWLMDKPIAINPLFVSKMNTTAQIAFAALLLGTMALALPLGLLEPLGQWLVAALTVVSTGAYLALWLKHMAS